MLRTGYGVIENTFITIKTNFEKTINFRSVIWHLSLAKLTTTPIYELYAAAQASNYSYWLDIGMEEDAVNAQCT